MRQQTRRMWEVWARETGEEREVMSRVEWGRRVAEKVDFSLRDGRREGVVECVTGSEGLGEGISR